MCWFCEKVKYNNIQIPINTTGADDNVCELITSDDCENCHGCADENNHFNLILIEDVLEICYYHKIKELTVNPYSARFNINYCPFCGDKISKEHHDELKFW